jgi:hypothetical protein
MPSIDSVLARASWNVFDPGALASAHIDESMGLSDTLGFEAIFTAAVRLDYFPLGDACNPESGPVKEAAFLVVGRHPTRSH